MADHLSTVRFMAGNQAPLLAIVETAVAHDTVRPGEKRFRQGKENPMIGDVRGAFGRVEREFHILAYTPKAYIRQAVA